jgi:hypothetical protein
MDLIQTRLEELAALLRVEKSYLDKVISASIRTLLSEVIIERLLTTLVKYTTPMLLEESLAKRERAEPSRLFTLYQGSLDNLTTLVNSISLSP